MKKPFAAQTLDLNALDAVAGGTGGDLSSLLKFSASQHFAGHAPAPSPSPSVGGGPAVPTAPEAPSGLSGAGDQWDAWDTGLDDFGGVEAGAAPGGASHGVDVHVTVGGTSISIHQE